MAVFQIGPLILELTMVVVIIGTLFPWYYLVIIVVSIVAYVVDTFVVTEWRAKYFKELNNKDNAYVSRSTDSLLNFETVKYFNAEAHETARYKKALMDYKWMNVKVTKSMIVLNLSQAVCIGVALALNLIIANNGIQSGTINIGDFIMLNTYILQIYTPLGFLGTMWRLIR